MASFSPNGFPNEARSAEQRSVDEHYIDTPEQVELRFGVAGIGSRFVAILLDTLILYFSLLVVLLIFVLFGSALGVRGDSEIGTGGKWFIAVLVLLVFVLLWGYFALFEALWHGQTPGKRVMKLRVIKDSGRQITLFEALARNLVRFIDYLPGMYLTGVITMLCNKRNQRLGDMVAGTIVVHERADEQPLLIQTSTTILAPKVMDAAPWQGSSSAVWGQAVPSLFPADAVAKLSAHDLMVMETFFARMLDLPTETRAAMAYRIAGQMTAKMGVTSEEPNPERVLESLAMQMRGSGQAR
jgi:uncharacterized RDD family membrane protein YckC